MTFEDMRIIDPILRAVRAKGYDRPTPIQRQTFAPVAEGRDLIGCAQTGTGKTGAFALPTLQRLIQTAKANEPGKSPRRAIRALVLSPTRELACQIADSFSHYGKHTGLRHAVVYGGVKQGAQVAALRAGVDILVATPGRLLDLLNQRVMRLDRVEILILDEADRMLDMGFIDDIRKVVSLVPAQRQTLMFSATMAGDIRDLARSILKNPVQIEIAAESPAAVTVHQSVAYVDHTAKDALLRELLAREGFDRTLVFARTKRGCDRITRRLTQAGYEAAAIHSDRTQGQRQRALEAFKRGKVQVLVASDIAARGLDVSMVSHVVNYDLPADAETYVHRIGRTGRAGEKGRAITFVCPDQRRDMASIERTLKKQLHVVEHAVTASSANHAARAERDRAPQQAARTPRPAAHPKPAHPKAAHPKAAHPKAGHAKASHTKSVHPRKASAVDATGNGSGKVFRRRGRGVTVAAAAGAGRTGGHSGKVNSAGQPRVHRTAAR